MKRLTTILMLMASMAYAQGTAWHTGRHRNTDGTYEISENIRLPDVFWLSNVVAISYEQDRGADYWDYGAVGTNDAHQPVAGSQPTWRTNSLWFDGTNDSIIIANGTGALGLQDSAFGTRDKQCTMSLWVRAHDWTQMRMANIFGASTNNRAFSFISTAADLLQFTLYDEHGDQRGRSYSTALTSEENKWLYVAASCGGTGVLATTRLYTNAVRVDTTDVTSVPPFGRVTNTTASLEIGSVTNLSSFSDGEFGIFRCWHGQLSPLQITNDYNSTRSLYQ